MLAEKKCYEQTTPKKADKRSAEKKFYKNVYCNKQIGTTLTTVLAFILLFYAVASLPAQNQNFNPCVIWCLFSAITLLLIGHYSVNNLYAKKGADCGAIIEYLNNSGFDTDKQKISWFISPFFEKIYPVIETKPTSSILQRITNLFKKKVNQKHKYEYRILKMRGEYGKKVSAKNVDTSIEVARWRSQSWGKRFF